MREFDTAFLDLQFNYLLALDGPEFLRELRRTTATLQGRPLIADLLCVFRDERERTQSRYVAQHDALVRELLALKTEVVRLDPASQALRAERPTREQMDVDWFESSFAAFDAIVAGESFPLENTASSRATQLCGILRLNLRRLQHEVEGPPARIVRENLRPDLNPVAAAFVAVDARVRHAERLLAFERETSPGFALAEVEEFVGTMITAPDADSFFDPLLDQEEALVDGWVREQKRLLRRLRHHISSRLNARRSSLSLLDRFRARCQWHARDELYALANSRGGKPEDKLVLELARWLHDAGLNPLGQASAGGLRPDLFDPSRRPAVYVEAKQYRKAPLAKIRQALKQVEDTAAQFTGEPYRIEEAFLVVFRLDGPLVTPAIVTLPRGGYDIHIVIVDLKPIIKVGSREKSAPVLLSTSLLTEGASDASHRQSRPGQGRRAT